MISLRKLFRSKQKPFQAGGVRKSNFSILREIIITSNLDIRTAMGETSMWDNAEGLISAFLESPNMETSDLIYLPGRSSLTRAVLHKREDQILVKHIDSGIEEFMVDTLVYRR